METRKEIEFVESEYWTCANPQHRHRQEDVAKRCIEKSQREKVPVKRWSRDEVMMFLARKNSGQNMAKLARDLGMSASNMTRLVDKAKWILRKEAHQRKMDI